jgi:hypothetical protein
VGDVVMSLEKIARAYENRLQLVRQLFRLSIGKAHVLVPVRPGSVLRQCRSSPAESKFAVGPCFSVHEGVRRIRAPS